MGVIIAPPTHENYGSLKALGAGLADKLERALVVDAVRNRDLGVSVAEPEQSLARPTLLAF